MRVLILGWEFPPYITGGLGVYCYELTKQLSAKGIDVIYVLPKRMKKVRSDFVKVVEVGPGFEFGSYNEKEAMVFKGSIEDYNNLLVKRCLHESFDVIHAQDWMVFDAAVRLKKITGKPLICHAHAIEYMRTPHDPWSYIVEKEKTGYYNADLIIANSYYMKRNLVEKLGVDPRKIVVIYNAVDQERFEQQFRREHGLGNSKIVLYLGRLFVQKGPDYFLNAAKKVVERFRNVKFLIAGTGDMLPQLIKQAIDLGISDKVMFLGFVPEEEKPKYYAISDVYVLPSVSEPFGITVLEAVAAGTPVVISKESGASEVVRSAFKVDFWDVNKMAELILGLLMYPPMAREMSRNGKKEIKHLTWDKIAEETIKAYKMAVYG
ncbi:hypothetical protein DRN74_03425 [Candidatus Micrarchaeota archaeon]|nr:MAG: hypothetical protein DRN74_03425 [Candidatus Micrarchaeota archaeon]